MKISRKILLVFFLSTQSILLFAQQDLMQYQKSLRAELLGSFDRPSLGLIGADQSEWIVDTMGQLVSALQAVPAFLLVPWVQNLLGFGDTDSVEVSDPKLPDGYEEFFSRLERARNSFEEQEVFDKLSEKDLIRYSLYYLKNEYLAKKLYKSSDKKIKVLHEKFILNLLRLKKDLKKLFNSSEIFFDRYALTVLVEMISKRADFKEKNIHFHFFEEENELEEFFRNFNFAENSQHEIAYRCMYYAPHWTPIHIRVSKDKDSEELSLEMIITDSVHNDSFFQVCTVIRAAQSFPLDLGLSIFAFKQHRQRSAKGCKLFTIFDMVAYAKHPEWFDEADTYHYVEVIVEEDFNIEFREVEGLPLKLCRITQGEDFYKNHIQSRETYIDVWRDWLRTLEKNPEDNAEGIAVAQVKIPELEKEVAEYKMRLENFIQNRISEKEHCIPSSNQQFEKYKAMLIAYYLETYP